MAYKKINFKNLPDTTTPINDTNLNQLQTNTEDEFLLKESMITIRSSTLNATTTTDSTFQKLPLNIQVNKIGSKLSYNSNTGEITIGSGISYVKVSASASLQYQSGNQTYFGITILKNNTMFGSIISEVRNATNNSTNYNCSSLNNILIDVQEGDKIAMAVFNRIAGSTNAIYPILTVEVVK